MYTTVLVMFTNHQCVANIEMLSTDLTLKAAVNSTDQGLPSLKWSDHVLFTVGGIHASRAYWNSGLQNTGLGGGFPHICPKASGRQVEAITERCEHEYRPGGNPRDDAML